MSRVGLLLLTILLGGLATPATAQVSGPAFTFFADTIISPDEANENFSTIYSAALNRFGGTMAGTLLFSADNFHDVGAPLSSRPRDLHIGRNAAIGGTLTVTGATTLTGGIAGNLAVVGTMTAALFSGSGASLTNIPETAIADGLLLARVGGSETITGAWTFTNSVSVSHATAPTLILNNNGTAADTHFSLIRSNTAGTWLFTVCNDATSMCDDWLSVARTGATSTLATFTPPVAFRDGTAAVPGLTFANDLNTGLYRAGVDRLAFATAGSARWEIDASGHLLPETDGTFNVGSASVGVERLFLDDTSGSDSSPQLAFAGDDDTGFLRPSGGGVAFVLNGARWLELNSAGTAAIVGVANTTFSGGVVVGGLGTGVIRLSTWTAATLPASTNGSLLYCSDCTIASPCAGSGTGALAKRLNGVWVCN